jgi:methylthioribose-1-phosphate isomerase
MRTVFWDYEAGTVKMIDQRLLPWEFIVAEFEDYHEVARAITEMYVRGAPAIGAAAGFGMALAAQQSQTNDRLALIPASRGRLAHADGNGRDRARPGARDAPLTLSAGAMTVRWGAIR